MNQSDWLVRVKDSLVEFLGMLQMSGQPGRFLPCTKGLTQEGRQIVLGFSCFALKIYYTLGLWEKLHPKEQKSWLDFLKSFQTSGNPMGKWVAYNAFIDEPIITYLGRQTPRYKSLIDRVFYPNRLTYLQRVIIAETKQAVATLAQVGESSDQPYRGFPITEKKVNNYLSNLDWTQPWGAGAQLSALAVFLTSQAPSFLKPEERQQLLDACLCFIESLADKETGAYFQGPTPAYGMLINGAMKILTALDWLNVPIHYAERLIDTCLERLPSSEGCHLVDAVYVIYRCSQQSEHRKAEVQTCCNKVLGMIKEHYNSDGGFSYNVGRSQTHYYGVPISQGLVESDIHGTCLIIWAVSMILEILDNNWIGWNVIRP
ncbi:MAG: hypothetical protein KAQ81_06865 [Deltaproteobacteria bacterium]|nr:hypothetical protein [Deltaproteobacteria bacterium]